MKQTIRDYFTFNKRERNGVFILLLIIAAELIYLNVSSLLYSQEIPDLSAFEKEIAAFEASIIYDSVQTESKLTEVETVNPAKPERFSFDPNQLPEKDWKRLGLSDKQIRTIKNYESKGGKFKRKEDLKKMYCINQELFLSLEPYINIESPVSNFQFPVSSSQHQKSNIINQTSILELNSCDSAQLTTIKGIGPFFAKAIIKYRTQLGGFISKEQLLEVWKFDQEKYRIVEAKVSVDATRVTKININTCTLEQLKHPYIRYNLANAIVNYRKSHGRFKTIEEIRNTDLVDEETLRRIVFYLKVE